MDERVSVGRPGLEHANARPACHGEPMGDDAAGAAGADDEIIEDFGHGPVQTLVHTDTGI